MQGTTIACVGGIIRDDRGRLLLVCRGTEPDKGKWSVPGGKVEPGETSHQGLLREVAEETSLRVVISGLAGVVERPAPDGGVFVIEDYFARVEPGTDPHSARAGSDAAEVGWFSVQEIGQMDCVDGLVAALQRWRVIAQQR